MKLKRTVFFLIAFALMVIACQRGVTILNAAIILIGQAFLRVSIFGGNFFTRISIHTGTPNETHP